MVVCGLIMRNLKNLYDRIRLLPDIKVLGWKSDEIVRFPQAKRMSKFDWLVIQKGIAELVSERWKESFKQIKTTIW